MQQVSQLEQDPRLQTKQVTPELIAYIVQKIARAVAPQRIILFGSYARGEAAQTSDLDLFIAQDEEFVFRLIGFTDVPLLRWDNKEG